MCSIHYEEIEFGRHALSFAKKTLDYRLIKIDTINRDDYRAWHDDIVMDYLGDEDLDENYCNWTIKIMLSGTPPLTRVYFVMDGEEKKIGQLYW